MKRNLKIGAIVFVCFGACIFISFHEPNYLKDFDLKGKVKKVVLNNYAALKGADGKIKQGAWVDSSVYEFNENGKLTNALFYHGQKKPNGHELYTYDKDGHVSSHVKTYLNSTSDSSFFTFKNGLLMEKISYQREGTKISGPEKTVFLYKMDQIIGEIQLSAKGDTLHKIYNSYNAQGKLIKVIEMEPDSNRKIVLNWTEIHTYNGSGYLIGISVNRVGQNTEYAWEYNPQGDKIVAAQIGDWVTTQYNEYVYDANGNWIKCTSSISQEETECRNPKKNPQAVTTRTIIYY